MEHRKFNTFWLKYVLSSSWFDSMWFCTAHTLLVSEAAKAGTKRNVCMNEMHVYTSYIHKRDVYVMYVCIYVCMYEYMCGCCVCVCVCVLCVCVCVCVCVYACVCMCMRMYVCSMIRTICLYRIVQILSSQTCRYRCRIIFWRSVCGNLLRDIMHDLCGNPRLWFDPAANIAPPHVRCAYSKLVVIHRSLPTDKKVMWL